MQKSFVYAETLPLVTQIGRIVFLVVLLGTSVTMARGQSIQLALDDAPLESALQALRAQTSLDLIYADRLIRGRTASCTYTGSERREALRCVLKETGVAAERVRRGQYVLVAADDTSDEASQEGLRVTLSGHVRDAQTEETLPGAHVYLTALQAGTTTTRTGYFALSSLPPGPYRVRISYLGYQTVDTTLVAGGEAARIDLAPASIESEGVVVESTRDGQRSRQLPGMMSVALDRVEQLPTLGEPDLFKALQWTPGIRKSGSISGGLSVRGADPDQNLYLLDGAPVYHPWHAFSLISTFQTGTLHNTNLYRGAFPAQHGGRLSSVLDAQMKDGSRAEPTATAALSVLAGRFRIETPVTPKTSFMLSGRRSYIDKLVGVEHPVTDATGRRDTLRTGYYFFDASAKVTHRFSPNHRVSLSYYDGLDNLDLRLPFDLSLDFSSWLRPADLFFEVQQNWKNRLFSTRYEGLLSDDWYATGTAYVSRYTAQESTFVQPTSTASLTSDYQVELEDAGAKFEVDYYHSVAHTWKLGAEVSRQTFGSTLNGRLQRSPTTVDDVGDESRLSSVQFVAYAQDTYTPNPQWSIQPGVRISYFDNGNHLHVAPRLSVRYALHPRWLVLNGSAGLHVQYLHRIQDRYSLIYDLVSSRWIPSSAEVDPATGLQVGVGARSRPATWLTLEASAYRREATDILAPSDVFQTKDGLIGPGIEVGALLGQFVPADERAYGIELSALARRGPWDVRVGVATSRTRLRAPDRSDDRWRPADLDVPLSFRSAVSWTSGRWETTLATEIRSGYPISTPTARYRLGDPIDETPTTYLARQQINNGRLPLYARLDATVGYSFPFLSADWSVRLNVFNVTNRDNVIDRTFAPTDAGIAIRDQRGLPILPLLEMEMRL